MQTETIPVHNGDGTWGTPVLIGDHRTIKLGTRSPFGHATYAVLVENTAGRWLWDLSFRNGMNAVNTARRVGGVVFRIEPLEIVGQRVEPDGDNPFQAAIDAARGAGSELDSATIIHALAEHNKVDDRSGWWWFTTARIHQLANLHQQRRGDGSTWAHAADVFVVEGKREHAALCRFLRTVDLVRTEGV